MPASSVRRRGERTVAETLRPVPNDCVEIRCDSAKGRGVYARAPIGAGTLIEAAPVIIVPAVQCELIDLTILHDYYFQWDRGGGAVALGLVSLCNHARQPSARVRRNLAQSTLDLIALAPMAPGDEVTIDYNCPLWFEAQE